MNIAFLLAAYYQLRFINSKDSTNATNDFDKATPIEEQDLISGSLNHTLNANEIVALEFSSTKLPLFSTTYYLFARAVDGPPNSNVRIIELYF